MLWQPAAAAGRSKLVIRPTWIKVETTAAARRDSNEVPWATASHTVALGRMTLFERIGVDVGRIMPAEDAIRWAATNHVRYLDIQTDLAPNALADMPARASGIQSLCLAHGIEVGLHTLSSVNIAELSPFVAEAADAYLRAYIDLAADMGAGWIVIHAGYHFTADYRARRDAALERLKRASDYAEERQVMLLLENTNPEPSEAEVQYFCSSLQECIWFHERLASPNIGLSFTANHAHLCSEGIAGFVAALDMTRCREVRLADCQGTVEEHLRPGEGTIDFSDMFARIEAAGFNGHYMNQFGDLDDMLAGRRYLVEEARKAGLS